MNLLFSNIFNHIYNIIDIKYNPKLLKAIQSYQFSFISENNHDIIENSKIKCNIQKSKVIIIKYCENPNQINKNGFFIIVFYQTIITIQEIDIKNDQKFLTVLQNLFEYNPNISICFFPKSKDYFDFVMQIDYKEMKYDETFKKELKSFEGIIKFKSLSLNKAWEIIEPCIYGYLIKESYVKLTKMNRVDEFFNRENHITNPTDLVNDDYIELRNISTGYVSNTYLNYHITNGKLFLIKKPSEYDSEYSKLHKRERENLLSINHPFIPRIYGIIKEKEYLAIEYIKGVTLQSIKEIGLNDNEKITIIFELMIIFLYLHQKQFIYRDLKPDNVMIDDNKIVLLIDFDRMLNFNHYENSVDFCSNFSAPENPTYATDIYSLGQMIYYIIEEQEPNQKSLKFLKLKQYNVIEYIYKRCTHINPEKRPHILIIILEFYVNYHSKIKIHRFSDIIEKYINDFTDPFIINQLKSIINNLPEAQFNVGVIYFENKLIERDINRVIHYFSLSSDQNHAEAQFCLAEIYFRGKYIEQNINKAIHYYSLASDNNNTEAQYMLGLIYYEGIYIKQDINKSIHYYLLAGNKNHSEALLNLGIIYEMGKLVQRDINKAIHYLQLASNLNNPKAQFYLGTIYLYEQNMNIPIILKKKFKYFNQNIKQEIIKVVNYFQLASNNNFKKAQFYLGRLYYDGQYIKQDINKSIHYHLLAANQSHRKAQYYLGCIFYEGIYVEKNINKALHYLNLSSNLNYKNAHFTLGEIYYNGTYIKKDIDKAIYYFKLASDQNYSDAQFMLGLIYYSGEYIPVDVKKSIYYYILASNNGRLDAYCNLGFIYYEDKYIKRDIYQSIYYYKIAADKNYVLAQYFLGCIYSDGRYIKVDISKSIHYFSLAANQNHVESQLNLGVIYIEGKFIKPCPNKAIYYLSLASNQNDPEAQANLGRIYYENKYIERDIDKAIALFLKAANHNNYDAQFNLGMIYYEGKYVKQNINKSIYYFTLASKHNAHPSLCNLAKIYYDGIGIARDINKVIHYLSIVSSQNNAYAQCMLGHIYYCGQYITKDIDKAIHYYSLAAKQNYVNALGMLGFIYYLGLDVTRDINKAIHYFSLAADSNNENAMYILGFIYFDGKYITRDINKAIHYFSLCSNSKAQCKLGQIYFTGKYIKQNIDKAIHYFSLASNKNDSHSQFCLGMLYIITYNKFNITKAIHYLTLSSKQNYSIAQFFLGIIFYEGIFIEKNIDKAIYYIKKSAEIPSYNYIHNFVIGFFYHEGKLLERNIEKAIHYYKNASSFNSQYAKNNLGIIYLKESDTIVKNVALSIDYFNEAIKRMDDILSMYNLALIHLIEEPVKNSIDQSISLSVKALNSNFFKSNLPLCMALIKKIGLNINIEFIEKELIKYTKDFQILSKQIFLNIIKMNINDKNNYEKVFNSLNEAYYIYDYANNPIYIKTLDHSYNQHFTKTKNITAEFYDGFELEI